MDRRCDVVAGIFTSLAALCVFESEFYCAGMFAILAIAFLTLQMGDPIDPDDFDDFSAT